MCCKEIYLSINPHQLFGLGLGFEPHIQEEHVMIASELTDQPGIQVGGETQPFAQVIVAQTSNRKALLCEY